MLTLGIDTADKAACVCLEADNRLLIMKSYTGDRKHSEVLASLVQDCLTEAGFGIADLRRIAITNGPGSFTGVRIGVSFAKGLAEGLGIPVAGVSTLQAMASLHCTAHPVKREFACAMDARRGQVYAAGFAPDGSRLTADEAIPLSALEGKDIVWPDTSIAYGAVLAASPMDYLPAAALLAFYLRPSQAERERNERLAL
ncbi:MAG: tRNA (adenosine(37)-N6)-threonylcarbamoyltransferase complex dimerization subunit type 1 TsaB [Oscillospiraceae bacterium]|jgi:tRNA threonylcarbamoyladenosine biosynthesis protein TsaB|nr:tRNA (adenosine(37)-N6)-threonylcarbamoyltransferase complex dimerization subunit type 1 TsaB [Oscillospiraceae bacterium]